MHLSFSSFSDSNQSNDWQKVQYNTNLLKQRQINLYTNESVNYKWKLLMKWGKNIWEVSGELKQRFVFNLQKQTDKNTEPIILKSFSPNLSLAKFKERQSKAKRG